MAVVDRAIWDALGVELVPLYFELDGTFPNHEANPLKLENLRDLQAKVLARPAPTSASPSTATSTAPPSWTRRGEPVGSDLVTALIAGELLAREPGKHVLYDLRSSRAVAEDIAEQGGVPVRERVGHSFMKATLREGTAIFGGELAGHYYFRDNFYADCAIARRDRGAQPPLALGQDDVRARRAARAATPRARRSTSRSRTRPPRCSELAARLRRRPRSTSSTASPSQYDDWWFNVRPSNTEPLLRLVVEARTARPTRPPTIDELVALIGHPVDH